MNKILSCITIVFLGVILLTGCSSTPKPIYSDPNKQINNTFQQSNVMTVNQSYDATAVTVKIDTVELMKNNSDNKYNLIRIKGSYSILQDNTYWSLENSEIKINNSEITIPMLTTKRDNPLNIVNNESFEVVAYVTTTNINDIKTLNWTIQSPAFKNGDNFNSSGPVLNIPLTIIETNN